MTQKADLTGSGRTTTKTVHSGGENTIFTGPSTGSGNTTIKTAHLPGNLTTSTEKHTDSGNPTGKTAHLFVKNITSISNDSSNKPIRLTRQTTRALGELLLGKRQPPVENSLSVRSAPWALGMLLVRRHTQVETPLPTRGGPWTA